MTENSGVCARLKILAVLLAGILTACMASCANVMPVPGGTDAVNESCFSTEQDFKAYLATLSAGMAEEKVLLGLCHFEKNLLRLDRREVRTALMGNAEAPMPGNPGLILRLYGYRMSYGSVLRKHGFASPIRLRTDETGFSYTVTLIFLDGRLFEPPILSGGIVNNSNTRTLFDYLTPGVVISHVN